MHLDTRPRQWFGALAIVGWVALLAFGLPRIAAAIPNETATVAGQPVTTGGVTLTPAEGWVQPADATSILVLRKDGAQITAIPPQPATGDASSIVQPIVDVQRNDTATGWQISDEQPFTTAAGAEGVWVVSLAPTQFVANFGVVQDGKSVLVTVSGTDTAWSTLKDEILTVLSSLQLAEAAS